jgi:hypothetical protein
MADQAPPPSPIPRPFSFSFLGLDRVRVGSGVVGHTTYTQLGFCAAAAAVAFALSGSPFIALGGIGILAATVLAHNFGTWRFASRHPDLAAAGDTEYRRLRELQMGAQGFSSVPEITPVSDPLEQLPSLASRSQNGS